MSDSKYPSNLTKTAGVACQIGHGGKSILKTVVLRRDRLEDREVDCRLAVCRVCPGGHAVFRRGRLRSCGKLLGEFKGRGRQQACGCILRHKARDAREDCPMGYWPALSHDYLQSAASQEEQLIDMGTIESPPNSGVSGKPANGVPVEVWAPKRDTMIERTVTGRTRRLLDVENRRMRLQARRQRLAQKKQRRELARLSAVPGAALSVVGPR